MHTDCDDMTSAMSLVANRTHRENVKTAFSRDFLRAQSSKGNTAFSSYVTSYNV